MTAKEEVRRGEGGEVRNHELYSVESHPGWSARLEKRLYVREAVQLHFEKLSYRYIVEDIKRHVKKSGQRTD